MPEDQGRVRLITFMGLNTPRVPPSYVLGRGSHSGPEKKGRPCTTYFAGVALFDLIGQARVINRPDQVIVLSTEDAAKKRMEEFKNKISKKGLNIKYKLLFSGGPVSNRCGDQSKSPEVPFLPDVFDGDDRGPDPLWETFRILRQFMDVTAEPQPNDLKIFDGAQPDTIILDITHGFRITPFIAAAALVHQRMLDALRYERMETERAAGIATKYPRKPPRYLVYAAPDLKENGDTVIYDISRFVDMLAWTDSLGLFLRGGRLPQVEERSCQYPADTDGGRIDAMSAFPALPGLDAGQLDTVDTFLVALADVEADMLTMRTGDLLTGTLSTEYGQEGSAARARNALEKAREDIRAHAPPVGTVLEELETMLVPLALDETAVRQGLGQGAGLNAMRALSVRYLQVGRYLEALTMAVEGWTGMMAEGSESFATDPNHSEFSKKGASLRANELQKRLNEYMKALRSRISDKINLYKHKDMRNELNHGGFTRLNIKSSDVKLSADQSVQSFIAHEIDEGLRKNAKAEAVRKIKEDKKQ